MYTTHSKVNWRKISNAQFRKSNFKKFSNTDKDRLVEHNAQNVSMVVLHKVCKVDLPSINQFTANLVCFDLILKRF